MAGTTSGVRFEVQFHTQASLEAKELTHQAYERIRTITEADPAAEQETAELGQFQSKVNHKSRFRQAFRHRGLPREDIDG